MGLGCKTPAPGFVYIYGHMGKSEKSVKKAEGRTDCAEGPELFQHRKRCRKERKMLFEGIRGPENKQDSGCNGDGQTTSSPT